MRDMPSNTQDLLDRLDKEIEHATVDPALPSDLASEERRLELAFRAGRRDMIDYLIRHWESQQGRGRYGRSG